MIESYAEGYMAGFHEYSDRDNPYPAGSEDHAEWQRGNLDYWCALADVET